MTAAGAEQAALTGDLLGIDIGGTKIAAGVVDTTGTVVRRAVCATPRTGVLDAVVSLVRSLSCDPGRIGVAAPGVIDTTAGTVLSATDILPGWSGTRVRARLEARLSAPVTVDNDVRAMAYGEAHAGAGRAHPNALYISVGTGIGGALYRDGALLRGPHATAGEIAHLLVPAVLWLGGPCGCGRSDHLEGSASGPAIARAYRRRSGRSLDLPVIAALMRDGDASASEVIAAAARLLGRALAGLLAAIDGTAVIVAGGVAQIGSAFLQPLAESLRAEALPPLRRIPVLAAQLGTDAPVVGAALRAREVVTT
ncbi:MAG: ROK family protein [Sciscionella sp.]